MKLHYPLAKAYPVSSDFAAHLARHSMAPGIDFACPLGTEVLACRDGKVISSEWSPTGGRHIILYHEDGSLSLYCHLATFWRAKGEHVRAGETIGKSGNTGHSTGPHLHFAYKAGVDGYVDPAGMLGIE